MTAADKLRDYFKTNPRAEGERGYWADAAAYAGTTPGYAKRLFYDHYKGKESKYTFTQRAPIREKAEPPPITKDTVEVSLLYRRQEGRIRDLKRTNEILAKTIDDHEKRFDALLNIKQAVKPNRIVKIKPSGDKTEAVPVICISDIHLEQRVDVETVNGFNEYNPEIAAERTRLVFSNAMKLVNMFQKDTKITTVVIALLGDNIAGYIHEELMESNFLSPTEATPVVKKILIEGIKFFADSGFNVIVPCSRGNHGRTTVKKRFSTGYKNSYEQMMYFDMADTFKLMKYDNVKFIISKSEFVYVDILGKVNRFCHGDQFRYGAGVGGIFPPMLRWLNRKNSEDIKADCTFMGHWHRYYAAARKGFVVNGSVIGTDPYGFQFGNDPPVQCIQLIDAKRGYTGNWPIVI